MPKICYTHLSAEDRETPEPVAGPQPFVADDGHGLGTSAQYPESRVRPHRDERPLSCLHGTDAGGSPGASPTAAAQTPALSTTPGPLKVLLYVAHLAA